MADRVIMEKKEGEGTNSLYHRFVKQFRSSGAQTHAKNNRFHARKISKSIRRKDCMDRMEKREKFEKAYRLGKISSPRKSYRR